MRRTAVMKADDETVAEDATGAIVSEGNSCMQAANTYTSGSTIAW